MLIEEFLTTLYSVTTSLVDDIDEDLLSSLCTSTSTTSSMFGYSNINITIAKNYIESLPEEKLVKLAQELDNKETEIKSKNMILNLDDNKPVVKVYKKQKNQNQSM